MTTRQTLQASTARIGWIGLALILIVPPVVADKVIRDDLIVDGSACVGFDCVNGESFGFDTIRIKENNLRIKAQDTSATASFPSNDWQITFNDSANGGANKFSIDDIDGGRTPFTIEAGAPSHSLYVDDGGRLGLGTSTPVVDAHIKSGNTPTLRLEQDGSSGFTPQTWDVAGNEANFFIRDATNGSTLPFRIFPDAPSNALTIAGSSGNVGIGTTSPDSPLHVRRTDGTALLHIEEASSTKATRHLLELENNGRVEFRLRDSSVAKGLWTLANTVDAQRLINTRGGSGAHEFILFENGNVTITGEITTSGSCSGGCDLVFSEDYELESIEEHAAFMWENSYLPNVGPTPEEGPFNLSAKTTGMVSELEKAHIYIEQLSKQNAELRTRLEAIEGLLTELVEQDG